MVLEAHNFVRKGLASTAKVPGGKIGRATEAYQSV
jgi:hypothetical protein